MERFEMKVMTTNLNGPSGKGHAKKRQEIISGVLKGMTPKPAIVFAQEIGAPKKTDPPWKIDELTDYHKYPSNPEAGVAWDDTIFDRICFIDQAMKICVLETLTTRKVKRTILYNETHVDGFEGGRAAIVVLRHNPSGKNIMCVSWHGRSATADASKKEAELYILLDLVNGLLCYVRKKNTSNTCDAAIIAGDYNIRKTTTQGYLKKYSADFIMVMTDEREEENFKFDYFLWRGTEGFTFETNTWIIPLLKGTTVLDHKPVVASFSFGGKAGTGKKDQARTGEGESGRKYLYLHSQGKKYTVSCDPTLEKGDTIADFECTNPSEGQRQAVEDLETAGCKFDGKTEFRLPGDKSEKNVIEVVQKAVEKANDAK